MLKEKMACVWIGKVRLVVGLVKDRLVGCMGQGLQRILWQEHVEHGGRGSCWFWRGVEGVAKMAERDLGGQMR